MAGNFLDRRAFMRSGAAAATGIAAGMVAPPGVQAGPRTGWKMQLSCSSINFSSLPIEKAVARIAALGFDAIDIWSAHAGCPHLDDVRQRLGPDGLKQLLEKHHLRLYAFSVYRGGYPRYAELLGAAGGGVAVRGSTGPADAPQLTAAMKRLLESLKPLLDLAEKHDSYLAIENHGNALLHSIDSFKAFVDLNRHPRLGIALAPYHIQTFGGSVEEAIAICGRQLLFFYAWQRGQGTDQLPGIGPTDCTPWLAALAKVEFRWPVNPFMHHEPEPEAMSRALARSRDYLKSCYRKATAGAPVSER